MDWTNKYRKKGVPSELGGGFVKNEGSPQEAENLRTKAKRAFQLGTRLSEENNPDEVTGLNNCEGESYSEVGNDFEMDNDSRTEGELGGGSQREEAESLDSTLGAEEEIQDKDEDSSEQTRQLEEAKQEAQENFDKYLRAVAELENYKKRSIKERSDLLRYAGEHIARDLVDVVDDFERALSHYSDQSSDIIDGIKLIYQSFCKVLERHAIIGVDCRGKAFDPEIQEALATVPCDDQVQAGIVVEQFKKAYKFKDKLLRPAQVIVSVKPVSGSSQVSSESGDSSEEN